MDQEPPKNRLDEAKRAMGGNTLNNQPDSLSKEKLAQARLEMSGQDYLNKENLKQEELAQKREEARRQMEGYERRHEREVEEYKKHEVERVKEELDRLKKEKGSPEEEEKKRLEALVKRKEEENKSYNEKLTNSQVLIEKLKQEKPVNIKSYHTLTTDISEIIKNDKLSMADIALKSEEKVRTIPQAEKSQNRLVAGLVLILIIIGSASIITIWFLLKDFGQPKYQESHASLIAVENTATIDTTAKPTADLEQEINLLLNKQQSSPRSITEIIFEETIVVDEVEQKRYLNSTDLLKRLQISTGQSFVLALRPKFMVGLFTEDDLSASPFYVFTINSYELAFDALLQQEGQIMSELLTAFGQDANLISEAQFTDEFISNINVRTALTDSGNNTKVFYTFPNRNTLVFTTSPKALLDLIEAVRLLNITQ